MSTPTIAQKVDTQARVIRSLNLIHCADTQHMVGAVELERLLNLEVENKQLKHRIERLEGFYNAKDVQLANLLNICIANGIQVSSQDLINGRTSK